MFVECCLAWSYPSRQELLQWWHYIDINWKFPSSGSTALHHASSNDRRNIVRVELLLDHGADIEARRQDDATPLMMACVGRHLSATNFRLDRRCKIHAVDIIGDTALHHACFKYSTHCVKELLAYWADTTIKKKLTKNCAWHCRWKPFPEVTDLEHKKCPEQSLMNYIQDEKNSIISVVRACRSEVSSLEERLATFEGRRDYRWPR